MHEGVFLFKIYIYILRGFGFEVKLLKFLDINSIRIHWNLQKSI